MAKLRVLDELGIKKNEGGLYAILQYDDLDKNGFSVFKLGLTINYQKRIDSYHTTGGNLGSYIIALLSEIPTPKITRGTKITHKMQLLRAEKYLFAQMVKNGARRIHSNTHIVGFNDAAGGGETEQFFCDQKMIEQSMVATRKEYGGVLHLYDLNGYDEATGKQVNFAKQSRDIIKSAFYVGKVAFV